MFTDYNTFKRETLGAISHLGRVESQRPRALNAAQVRKLHGKNIMADDVWQFLTISHKGRSVFYVEVAYSFFCGKPLLGLTVFPLYGTPEEREEDGHRLGNCYFSPSELAEALDNLQRLATTVNAKEA